MIISRQHPAAALIGRPARKLVYTAPVCSVRVDTERLRYFADGRQLVLELEDGRDVLLTDTCMIGSPSGHHRVARTICAFLGIDPAGSDMADGKPSKAGVEVLLCDFEEDGFVAHGVCSHS